MDIKKKVFIEERVSLGYSAQCCGFTVDYQVLDLSHLVVGAKTDHRFNFAFTLAGLGSFSNPLGSFGRLCPALMSAEKLNVLVTGGAGFIGSNFVRWAHER